MNVKQAVAWMSQPGIMASIHDRTTKEAVKTLIKAVMEEKHARANKHVRPDGSRNEVTE